jgi:ketosteroid isomerase-like protein
MRQAEQSFMFADCPPTIAFPSKKPILKVRSSDIMEGIMSEQANISLLKQAYAAYDKGDIQTLLGLLAQDIEWELPEVEGIPFTGKRHGLAQVSDFFRVMAECQEAREFKPDRFLAQGDQVIVLGHATFTVKTTGAEYSDAWCHVFNVAGGKIASFKEYSDTHRAAQAYQAQGAGIGAAAGKGATRPAVH